jgi:spore maturation protein SpmA
VAQQLEVAIFEGLPSRLATRRKASPTTATTDQVVYLALRIAAVFLIAVVVLRYQEANGSAGPPVLGY